MDRRLFLQAAISAPIVFATGRSDATAMPPIRYTSIPARDTDKVDCLPSTGYFGGTIEIGGKEIGVLFKYSEREWKRRGLVAVESELRHRVDERLREMWLGLR